MGLSVQQRAECVGTFRWAETRLMRTLAQWVPTTPEMELKILFGRHVWDCAQHADALGRRAFELRAPLHYTLPATKPYQELLQDVAALSATADRIAVLYDVVLPGLAACYRTYQDDTDALMDEPSVRILDGALRDFSRMEGERTRLAGVLQLGPCARPLAEWQARAQSVGRIVVHGDANARQRGVRS